MAHPFPEEYIFERQVRKGAYMVHDLLLQLRAPDSAKPYLPGNLKQDTWHCKNMLLVAGYSNLSQFIPSDDLWWLIDRIYHTLVLGRDR